MRLESVSRVGTGGTGTRCKRAPSGEDSGKLLIYNTIGQCVLDSPLNKGLNLMSVDLNGVSSGLYSVVAVVNGEVTLSEKISIVKE